MRAQRRRVQPACADKCRAFTGRPSGDKRRYIFIIIIIFREARISKEQQQKRKTVISLKGRKHFLLLNSRHF